MKKSIFEIYPHLNTLKDLVKEEIIENEIRPRINEFNEWRVKSKEKIKTVRLCDIFPEELETCSIYLENFLGHWGNVTIEELCKITLIVKYFRPKTVFEFGTYNGMTTLQIALNTPEDTMIYTLDLSPEMANNTRFKLSELDKLVAAEFCDKFHTGVGSYFKGKSTKIIQILADSGSYDYSRFYNNIDFIFIDGAHDYENKKSDSENALKMLNKDGIILWDNYDDILNPEVTKYLGELAMKLPLYHLKGTPLVVYWRKA